MRRPLAMLLLSVMVAVTATVMEAAPRPLLIQTPSVSATQIAFAWAGQIWIVSRDGGDARRLVAGSSRQSRPAFSHREETEVYDSDGFIFMRYSVIVSAVRGRE